MRRAAQLYPGAAKTDPPDSFVLADTARTHRRRIHWLAASDDLLEQLRVLVGFDNDLAVDVNRTTNRLRDALTWVAPALERVLDDRLDPRRSGPCSPAGPPQRRCAPQARPWRRLCRKHAPRAGDRFADDITTALTAQTVTGPAEATLGRVIAELATELERLYQRRARLASEIEEVFLAHPFAQLLISMPGIGTKTGATISPRSVTAPRSRPPATSPPMPGSEPPTPGRSSSVAHFKPTRPRRDSLDRAPHLQP